MSRRAAPLPRTVVVALVLALSPTAASAQLHTPLPILTDHGELSVTRADDDSGLRLFGRLAFGVTATAVPKSFRPYVPRAYFLVSADLL